MLNGDFSHSWFKQRVVTPYRPQMAAFPLWYESLEHHEGTVAIIAPDDALHLIA